MQHINRIHRSRN